MNDGTCRPLRRRWIALIFALAAALVASCASGIVSGGDGTDLTPLARAVRAGDVHAVRQLLAQGADPDQDIGRQLHYAPLVYAVETGNDELVKVLLESGANPNFMIKDGKYYARRAPLHPFKRSETELIRHIQRTPLLIAAQKGRLTAARLLIAAGADVNHRDVFGHDAREYARQRLDGAMERLLVESGAKLRWRELDFP